MIDFLIPDAKPQNFNIHYKHKYILKNFRFLRMPSDSFHRKKRREFRKRLGTTILSTTQNFNKILKISIHFGRFKTENQLSSAE